MNAIHFLFMFSFLSFPQQKLEKQQAIEPLTKIIVLDHKKSDIKIIGTTNVNEFSCVYSAKILADTLEIELSSEGNLIATSGVSFKLPVSKFKCENSQMDSEFQALLKVKRYPNINIQLLGIYDFNPNKHVKVAIELAGVEKDLNVLTDITVQKNVFHCQGKPEVCITDFGLSAPEKFFGMIKVNETIRVEFNLTFSVINI